MSTPRNSSEGRPYVLINMAMSADGKIATTKSHFSRFGSPRDEANLFRIRSTVDGIMSGATTISKERATLTLKSHPKQRANRPAPLRIIVTSKGSVPLNAPIFTDLGPPILILTTQSIPETQFQAYQKLTAGIHRSRGKAINWKAAVKWLHQKWKIERLLCEGGGKLNQSLLKSNLVDELNLTICPVVVGGTNASTIADGEAFPSLNDCSKWKIVSRKQSSQDCFLRFIRADIPE
ncbi:dihydrofolate reductase family protein [Verrucomicrobia bacterium]|nr:dihydrofolate reductase family protein [bacterium]MDB4745965.1 dihydrofolate reductase family protein [Verrucomicrobiota bacterium]MDB4798255.1 dihydrofolate reductase family protein [Verrucomicrobiota bacterium]